MCIGFGAQEIPLLHSKQKKKKKKKIMTKKVGRLRNETAVYLEYTFSCTFHDKHSPRKSASKHRCMLFFPLSSSLMVFFFPFFQWVKPAGPRESISFTIKGYWKKIIWGYNKIKETPNNIAHSHGVGCVGCCVGWLWKTLATRANYWLAPSFVSWNSWHNTTSFEESSVGQVWPGEDPLMYRDWDCTWYQRLN